jgi:hypothetical protein
MKKHLERELIEIAPNLYRGIHLSRNRSLMYKGFECGDGWFTSLKEASLKVENILKKMPKKERRNNFAMHVISKNGCLRIYMSVINHTIEKFLSELVSETLTLCEKCGDTGERDIDKTRCPEHKNENNVRSHRNATIRN